MEFIKNKVTLKKVLIIVIILSIFSLAIINFIKYKKEDKEYINYKDNNFSKDIDFSKKSSDIILVNYQNELINKDSIEKFYNFILTLKNNKNFHYEFRRQIEKRNLIDVLVDKEEFRTILLDINNKNYFDKNTLNLIDKEFGNFDNFSDLFYYFYVSLFVAQIEDKILDLKKYKESLEDKLYKIKPQALEELKQNLSKIQDTNEKQKIEELVNELSKNNYKVSKKTQIKLLEEKINEVKEILDLYNSLKDKDYYKWVVDNKQEILKELRY
jgi:hypothetical protein